MLNAVVGKEPIIPAFMWLMHGTKTEVLLQLIVGGKNKQQESSRLMSADIL